MHLFCRLGTGAMGSTVIQTPCGPIGPPFLVAAFFLNALLFPNFPLYKLIKALSSSPQKNLLPPGSPTRSLSLLFSPPVEHLSHLTVQPLWAHFLNARLMTMWEGPASYKAFIPSHPQHPAHSKHLRNTNCINSFWLR